MKVVSTSQLELDIVWVVLVQKNGTRFASILAPMFQRHSPEKYFCVFINSQFSRVEPEHTWFSEQPPPLQVLDGILN